MNLEVKYNYIEQNILGYLNAVEQWMLFFAVLEHCLHFFWLFQIQKSVVS